MSRGLERTIWVLALPLAVGAGSLGCCSAQREAARDIMPAWKVYRKYTVPNPDLTTDEARELQTTAHKLEAALRAVAGEESESE